MIDEIAFQVPDGLGEGDCRRLFHGRGHAFPGYEHINIDWFSPVVLIMLYREVSDDELQPLVDAIRDQMPLCRSIQVQHRYLREAPCQVLWGESISETTVTERGLRYHVEFGRSRNLGLFLDMAEGRDWVREHSQGKRVLNLFAYTCAFSVAAIAGGASHVVNIDNNKGVLRRGRENHRLNNQDLKRVSFEGVNIFQSWSRLRKHGPYDLLICDPPAFQVGSVNIERDYKKIISRLPQFMSSGARLLLCLNSPELDQRFLREVVATNCPACKFIEEIPAPIVFREAYTGKGLKVLLFEYSA